MSNDESLKDLPLPKPQQFKTQFRGSEVEVRMEILSLVPMVVCVNFLNEPWKSKDVDLTPQELSAFAYCAARRANAQVMH
jgi:hypothetical protein